MEWISGGLSALGNIAGSLLSNYSSTKASEANEAFQREFAQNGLSWKVADAKKAGINPLVALGASTYNATPTRVGTDYGDLGLGRFGQDISRSMSSKMTNEQREIHELNKELLRVKIDGQKIDNENARNIGTGPALPTPDYIDTPDQVVKNVTVKPAEVISAKQKGVEAGVNALYTDAIDDRGLIWRVPSQQFAEVLESSLPHWLRHIAREFLTISNSQIATWIPKYRKYLEPELRKIRPPSPRNGWEYRWNLAKSAWRLSKIESPGRTKLFDIEDRPQDEKRFKFPNRR